MLSKNPQIFFNKLIGIPHLLDYYFVRFELKVQLNLVSYWFSKWIVEFATSQAREYSAEISQTSNHADPRTHRSPRSM